MAIISRLGVVLGLDTGEFNKNMGMAQEKLKGFSASSLLAKVSLATLGYQTIQFVKDSIAFADAIDNVAKANDISTKSVIQLSEALQLNGGESANAGKLLSSFTSKIDEAAQGSDKTRKSLAELGITLSDIKNLSVDKLLEKTFEGFSKLDNTTRRNALSMDLFGKAVKGADIKGFYQAFKDGEQTTQDTDVAFAKIAESIDKIDLFMLRLKVSAAELFGPVFAFAVDSTMKLWEATQFLETGLEGLVNAFDKYLGDPIRSVLGKEPISVALKKEADALKVVRDEIIGGRTLEESEETVKANEALTQKINTLNLEIETIGRVKTEYEKLNAEISNGGKYAKASQEKINEAIEKAKALDQAKNDQAINNALELERITGMRLEVEKSIIGMSDTQKEYYRDILQLTLDRYELEKKFPNLTKEQLDAFSEAREANIEFEREVARAQNTFQAGWSTAYENFKEKASDSFSAGEMAFESMTSNMESALDRFVQTGKLSFSDLARSIIQDLIKMQLKAQVTSIFSSIGGMFGFGGGSGYSPGFSTLANAPFPMFADGGDPPVGQASIVGERGPELFVPRSAGTIIPNNQLGSAMGNKPQIVYNGPYIQNMSAIDTQSATQFLAQNKTAVWSANQSAQRSLPQSR